MKDITKINDILNSIKQVRNYQKRSELNLTIDSLLSKFLPENLKQDVKAFSLEGGTLTLILNSSASKANFIFIEEEVLTYLNTSSPKLQISAIKTKINRMKYHVR
ncbi:MAG: hypothetical protein CBC29_04100 [Methylococcaceae bacterium TMED69]|nr:MAG: hypothetical protein CBC29_04100 [Methylococcaceae bacterium TMED69]|tara:strand:+ start:432 stop:746 length:315 start_codon:yes stop_codon:yes gene_type:complete